MTSPGSGMEWNQIKLNQECSPSNDIEDAAITEWHAQRLIFLTQCTNQSRRSLERFQDITDNTMMINETEFLNTETDTEMMIELQHNEKTWKRKKKARPHSKKSTSSSRSRSRSKKRRPRHSRTIDCIYMAHAHTHTRDIRTDADTASDALSSKVVAKTLSTPGHNHYYNEHYEHIDEVIGADADVGADTHTGAEIQFDFRPNHDHGLFLAKELKGTSLCSLSSSSCSSSPRNCIKPSCPRTPSPEISESFTTDKQIFPEARTHM